MLPSVEAGSRYLFAFASSKEGRQANVYAHRRFTGGRNFLNLLVGDESDVPMAGRFLLDRSGLDRSFEWPVEHHRNKTDFRQEAVAVFMAVRQDAPARLNAYALWDSETVGALELLLSLGEKRSFLEEVGVGGVEVTKNLLECLTIGLPEPGQNVFEHHEFGAEAGEGQRLAGFPVVCLPSGKCPVPNNATIACLLNKTRLLF